MNLSLKLSYFHPFILDKGVPKWGWGRGGPAFGNYSQKISYYFLTASLNLLCSAPPTPPCPKWDPKCASAAKSRSDSHVQTRDPNTSEAHVQRSKERPESKLSILERDRTWQVIFGHIIPLELDYFDPSRFDETIFFWLRVIICLDVKVSVVMCLPKGGVLRSPGLTKHFNGWNFSLGPPYIVQNMPAPPPVHF